MKVSVGRLPFRFFVRLVFFQTGALFAAYGLSVGLAGEWFVNHPGILFLVLMGFFSVVSVLMLLRIDQSDDWVSLEQGIQQAESEVAQKAQALTREHEELEALMGAISEAIVAVGASGEPLFFNSRFAVLFGGKDFESRRPRIGEIFRAPDVLDAFNGALREGTPKTAEVRLALGTGVERFYSLSVAPLFRALESTSANREEVSGAIGVFYDITELKRAERIRIEFVANVSHELRTPLTAIKGFSDTVAQDFAAARTEDVGFCLSAIQRNVDRLMSLVQDLLDLSALESGVAIEKQWVDTAEITTRVVSPLQALAKSKNQEIKTEFLAKQVFADPGRLEQVLTNLIQNAIKYVQVGGEIKVQWEHLEKSVRLSVLDNGPGIPHESQARLFERFYRVDKARSREQGGTGLGLAIVKHILQRHGGSARVESAPGKGTQFTCEFPSR